MPPTTSVQFRDPYGEDSPALAAYIQSKAGTPMSVDMIEVFKSPNTHRMNRSTHTEINGLSKHIYNKAPSDQIIRVLNVKELSGPLIQLLGSKYQMDYELWTCRFQTSDREWFAGPMIERGARQFSHFNLSCVDFKSTTINTPSDYAKNRKLGHTVRLMRFLDLTPQDQNGHLRVYVIRRIGGHIRLDQNMWTFIYFNDPYVPMDNAHFVTDIPGDVQLPLTSWITEFISENSSSELIEDLKIDGFGFVLRVLREIKTTWKLLLHEMEVFLENMSDQLSDEELMDSAPWLHRQFILNIDYFQRQLLYHRRYVTYLMNSPSQEGLCISPTVFAKDLLQENDALAVVDTRLKAVRDRTSAILEAVVSLNAVKQAKLAGELSMLQRQDAALTFSQGQSIRRLTILNMIYLPATFIATVYGMNVVQNENNSAWSLWSFLGISIGLTGITLISAIFKIEVEPFRNHYVHTGSVRSGETIIDTVRMVAVVFFNWLHSFRFVRIRVGQEPPPGTA